MRLTFLVLMTVLVSGGSSGAAEMFPLNPGAVWEYRAEGVAEPLTIQVGLNQLYAGGQVYSRLTGYVAEPLWVRLNEEGDLYYLDEESGQDRLLTMLNADTRAWFEAPYRGCEQEGQAHIDGVPYPGPTGPIADTLVVRYRSFSCADVGVEAELFAANIGMVLRSVSTIAGPVVYWLTYADTGSVQLAPRGGVTLRLAVEVNGDESVTAMLRLTGEPGAGPTLPFPTSQEFDMLLRDESGAVLWRWSDGQVFTPALKERQAVNLSYEVEIPLQQGLPAGAYKVEAWLTSTTPDRAPRVSAVFRLEPQTDRTDGAIRPLRSRR